MLSTVVAHADDTEAPDQNYLAAAHQQAIDFFANKGCTKTKITILNKYQSSLTNDGIKIVGPAYRVRCLQYGKSVSLRWSEPKKREDGTAVAVDHYVLNHNNKAAKLGRENSIVLTDLDDGKHVFTVQAVDKLGVASKPSNEVAL